MNIFVAKLSASTTSEDLHELFADYGEVVSAKVITDKFTGDSKRFGFVEMKSKEDAFKAIKELDECEYDNSTIVVKEATPKSDTYQKKSFGGGNNGGNRRYEGNKRY
jgi:RNA recognition motif-containing protein